MPNTREKFIDACERELANYMTGREMRFVGGDVVPVLANQLASSSKYLASKWVPVTERLPEEDGQYLVFEKGSYGNQTRTLRFAKDGRKVDKYDFHRGWKNVWHYYDSEWGHITVDDVTHWMPLPQPPKGE